jgi:hypothetical protein
MLCPTAGDLSVEGARLNAMLTAPRELVSLDLAILAVDLASGKPAAVVRDHDSVVLGFPGRRGALSRSWRSGRRSPGWCWRASRPGTGGSRWR